MVVLDGPERDAGAAAQGAPLRLARAVVLGRGQDVGEQTQDVGVAVARLEACESNRRFCGRLSGRLSLLSWLTGRS